MSLWLGKMCTYIGYEGGIYTSIDLHTDRLCNQCTTKHEASCCTNIK